MLKTYLDSGVINSVRKFEWFLSVNAIMLAVAGIVLIYSATIPMGSAGRSFVIKQTAWMSLGIVLLILFSFIDYRVLQKCGLCIYIFILIALISVSIFGRVTAGSRRWIDFGLMRFQPS